MFVKLIGLDTVHVPFRCSCHRLDAGSGTRCAAKERAMWKDAAALSEAKAE